MVSSIIITAGGAVGQAAPVGYVAAVNGLSTDPVTVTAGGVDLGTLEYAADGVGATVPPGTIDITFTGGTVDSDVSVDLLAGAALTAVSGFGEDAATAQAYPIEVAPIAAGSAKIAVWNATDAVVTASVAGGADVDLDPGEGIPVAPLTAGTVTVEVDGISLDVDMTADSYTDVFAVTDGVTPSLAISQVVSMTDLIASLSPPAQVVVPDVVGLAQADATAAITGLGLVAGTSEAADDTVPVGSVISQNPGAGASVAPGSTVTITVSTGPGTVPVTDVTGQSAADAQANLEAAGFVVASEEANSVDVEAGFVIGTNPAAGTQVAPGTTVTITVSTGPGEVVVPDLFGLSPDEAVAAGESAGVVVTLVPDAGDPDPDGVIVSQDPTAGATVEAGSEVLARQAPSAGEAWAIVTLDADRLLTVSGINFLPGSTVDLSVVDTDRTAAEIVEDDGTWIATFDLSDVENETEFLEVRGTAADTSAFEATFRIPPPGETTDEPAEDTGGGFPLWGWIVAIIAVAAIALIIWRMVTRGSDPEPTDETTAADPDDPTDAGTEV